MIVRDAIGTILGVVLLVYPAVIVKPLIDRRRRRLEQLKSGAEEEKYFEERRSLEAYPPVQNLTVWRLIGLLLLLLLSSKLYLRA